MVYELTGTTDNYFVKLVLVFDILTPLNDCLSLNGL